MVVFLRKGNNNVSKYLLHLKYLITVLKLRDNIRKIVLNSYWLKSRRICLFGAKENFYQQYLVMNYIISAILVQIFFFHKQYFLSFK